jgi:hypothetical protein
MGWLLYAVGVLLLSGVIGAHLGRFRAAYTEMTGMMAGMTMGMLNGFLLGYAAAAATMPNGMFWGNLLGILLGLTLGSYFGRAGGLMGVMDGAMGGVMGGSMGAMLAVMLHFPDWAEFWTAVLLASIYLAGMAGLVVLIEQSAPEHAALHRLAPMFTRAVATEVTAIQAAERVASGQGPVNYYEMLDIPVRASVTQIATAYSAYVVDADDHARAVADQALATLTNPQQRARYDRELAVAAGRGECCPPPRRTAAGNGSSATTLAAAGTRRRKDARA